MFNNYCISRIQEEREERHRLKTVVKEQTKVGRPVEPTEPQIRLGSIFVKTNLRLNNMINLLSIFLNFLQLTI